jgi:Ca2+-binding EF-hand superfamily protein
VEYEVTDEQLDRVFHAYAKTSANMEYPTINAIQFSSLWRLITGNRGNLFQEMKIFNQFDAGNNGVLSAKDFREGWRKYYKSTGDVELVERMLNLAGRGSGDDANMIL